MRRSRHSPREAGWRGCARHDERIQPGGMIYPVAPPKLFDSDPGISAAAPALTLPMLRMGPLPLPAGERAVQGLSCRFGLGGGARRLPEAHELLRALVPEGQANAFETAPQGDALGVLQGRVLIVAGAQPVVR